ncbi:hypothetical protein M8J77_015491 [Diaphorina citri]|nr:hypothetical protein M8J77_015491 [Diaphorina citri]
MAHAKNTSGESTSFHKIMDQVPVKISELYRAPRKVTVSSGVLQRKHVEDLTLLYDFSLEKSISSKMGQMKVLRSKAKQDLKKSLADYQQAKQIEQFTVTAQATKAHDEGESEKVARTERKESHSDVTGIETKVPNEDVVPTAPPLPQYNPPLPPTAHMSPSPTPMSYSQLSNTKSPILSPVPFGYQSPVSHNGATRTPISSPIQFPTREEPIDSMPHRYSLHEASNMYTNRIDTSRSNSAYETNPTVSSVSYPFYNTNTAPNNVDYSQNISHPHGAISMRSENYAYPTSSLLFKCITIKLCLDHIITKQKVNVLDFESDTSSPFDNCELKSINDMEELRHVLEESLAKQQHNQQQHNLQLQHNLQQQHEHLLEQQQHNQQQQHNLPIQEQQQHNLPIQEQQQHNLQQHSQQQQQHKQEQQQHNLQQQNMLEQQQQYNPYIMQYAPRYMQEYSAQYGSRDSSHHYQPSTIPNSDQHHSSYIQPSVPHPSILPSQPQDTYAHPLSNKSQENYPHSLSNKSQEIYAPSLSNKPQDTYAPPPNKPQETNAPPVPEAYLPQVFQHSSKQNSSHQLSAFSNDQDTKSTDASSDSLHASAAGVGSSNVPHSSATGVASILRQLQSDLHRKQEIESRLQPTEVTIVHFPPASEASPPGNTCDIPPLPSPPLQVSYLHNPYLELNAKSQLLVDRITEIGFLQSRTARACQKFGPHQDKIVEFLIQVRSLEEQFPSLSATDLCEEALFKHKGDVSATVSCLEAVARLTRLGFEPKRVMSVLRSVGNNEERALDKLVS